MPSKRIDELTTRTVVNTDLLPPTPSGGPSGSATVAAVVRAGLQQPNSASAGAGADVTIKAADGVTSGAGGNIILQPGAQATTGGNGKVIIPYTANDTNIDITRDLAGLVINFRAIANNHYFELKRNDINVSLRFFPSDLVSSLQKISATNGLTIDAPALTLYGSSRIFGPVNNGSGSNTQPFCISGGFGVVRIIDNLNTSTGGSFSFPANSVTVSFNQNNYVLTGSAFQRLNCTTASDITGIAPPTGGAHVDGRMIRVVSVGTATVTLKHNSSSSTAANRIYSSTGADIALATNLWADLIYDATDNGSGAAGWRAK